MTARRPFPKAVQFAGYGVGDLGMNLFWNALSLLLIYWYTNVVGLSPATAGAIFFAATIWDALTDPVMAVVAERTQTRWGSYRPFVLFGGAALGASFIFLLWTPPLTGLPLIAVLLFAHLVFRTCYTIVGVPYSALTTRLTEDSKERTILSGLRMFFAFTGFFAISAAAFPIVRLTGDGSDVSKTGFTMFAAICAVVAFSCYVVTFITTREHAIGLAPKRESVLTFIKNMFAFARRNRAMHSMLAIIVAHSGANLIFFSTMTFFVETHAGLVRTKEEILGFNALLMLLTVPIWTPIAHRFGKRKAWIAAAAISVASGLHLAVFGAAIVNGFVVQLALVACCVSAFAVLLWSMIPDIIEYGQWKTGIRSESAAYGITLFTQKASIGLAGFAVGVLLHLAGYAHDAPSTASPEVADNVRLLVALGPSLLWFASIWAVLKHPVSTKAHAEAVARIDPEDLSYKAPVEVP